MSKTVPKTSNAANVFIYFYLNDAYQIRLLKIGCGLWVVFIIARIRSLNLKYKSKLWIFSNPNEFVSIK